MTPDHIRWSPAMGKVSQVRPRETRRTSAATATTRGDVWAVDDSSGRGVMLTAFCLTAYGFRLTAHLKRRAAFGAAGLDLSVEVVAAFKAKPELFAFVTAMQRVEASEIRQ